MKNFYVIVDSNDIPVSYYTDDVSGDIDIWLSDVDETKVYNYYEQGLIRANEILVLLNSTDKYWNKADQNIKFPLRIVKIKSERRIIL